jgi:hypothetical protein
MLALRAFSVGHFAVKLAWSFQISLSNPSRGKEGRKSTAFFVEMFCGMSTDFLDFVNVC